MLPFCIKVPLLPLSFDTGIYSLEYSLILIITCLSSPPLIPRDGPNVPEHNEQNQCLMSCFSFHFARKQTPRGNILLLHRNRVNYETTFSIISRHPSTGIVFHSPRDFKPNEQPPKLNLCVNLYQFTNELLYQFVLYSTDFNLIAETGTCGSTSGQAACVNQ